jgi:hypothetical protein
MTTSRAAARARGLPDASSLTVGVFGGTGPQGRGLTVPLAAAGQTDLLGSLVRCVYGPGQVR